MRISRLTIGVEGDTGVYSVLIANKQPLKFSRQGKKQN